MNDPMTLTEAAASLGLADSSALRRAILREKLTATKYGTTYVITAAEVERYRAESLGNQGNRRRVRVDDLDDTAAFDDLVADLPPDLAKRAIEGAIDRDLAAIDAASRRRKGGKA